MNNIRFVSFATKAKQNKNTLFFHFLCASFRTATAHCIRSMFAQVCCALVVGSNRAVSQIETLIRVRLQTFSMAVALDNTFMLQTHSMAFAVPLKYVVPECGVCKKPAFMFVEWAPHSSDTEEVFVFSKI
jgi:hypothetical protein